MLRAACASCPSLRDVNTDQQNHGLQTTLDDRPRHRRAAGHHAAADRQRALRRLRAAPGLDDVHGAEPVSRRDGSATRSTGRAPTRCSDVYVHVANGGAGAAERVRALRADQHAAVASTTRGSSPPSRSRSTWRRACRWAMRSTRSTRPSARSACPPSIHGSFHGHGAGVSGLAGERADADPRRAARRLHRARHALRELHPPAHDPLHAALGRRRRAAGAAAAAHRAQRHRADRHHPADRHREEERDHDDRLRARGRAQRGHELARTRSSRRACCASARS